MERKEGKNLVFEQVNN